MNKICNLVNMLSNCCGKDGWMVIGKTLQSYIKTGGITTGGKIEMVVDHGAEKILSQYGDSVNVTTRKMVAPPIKEFVPECRMTRCNFPANLGAVLDDWNPLWADMLSTRITDEKSAFFTKPRCKEAHEEIAIMLECAERAGIREKMFLGFILHC